LVTELVF